MTFVNVMSAAVPTDGQENYLKYAKIAAEFFKQNGATRCVECWGADVPDGEVTSFPMAVQKTDGEVVVVAWIEWPSKDVADAAFGKMMEDPLFDPATNPMPFDGKRLIFGGFDMIMDA